MNNNFIIKALFFTLLFSLLIPFLTWAITIVNPISSTTFEQIVNAIINFIFWVAIVIVPIMVIVAAYFFLTSGGDPAKTGQAKKVLLYTLIGLIIVLSGRGIVSIIGSLIGGGGGPGPGCIPPCNGICPAGCAGNPADPDCVCQNGDGCCGIGCNYTNDNNCGLTPLKLSALGDMNGDCVIDGSDILIVGDLNQDGVVNACDTSIINKITFGWGCGQLLTPLKLSALGDMNGDCVIDGSDILIVGDLNQDGVVNACDTSIINKITFGWGCD